MSLILFLKLERNAKNDNTGIALLFHLLYLRGNGWSGTNRKRRWV